MKECSICSERSKLQCCVDKILNVMSEVHVKLETKSIGWRWQMGKKAERSGEAQTDK